MKRDLLRYIAIAGGIFLLLQLVLVSGCSKMNDTYKEFLEGGPVKYIGKPDSVFVHPGKNRMQLSWKRPADPKIKGGIVFWNNGNDSAVIALTPGVDTLRLLLEQMPEGEYVFQVYSRDGAGVRSLGKEVVGRVYGAQYQASLLSRPVDSVFYRARGVLQLNWGGIPDTSIVGTEVRYTDIKGTDQIVFASDSVTSSTLDRFNGGKIKFRTVYVPERKAMDTFYTKYDSLDIPERPSQAIELDKTGWTATASSFDTRSGASYRPPSNTIDNNNSTIWVNFIGTPATDYPHWLQVDMGSLQENIEGFAIVTRLDAPSRPKTVELLTSEDGVHWQSYGDVVLANSGDKQLIPTPGPVNARYFKMIAKNAYDNGKNIAFAEIGVYRYD